MVGGRSTAIACLYVCLYVRLHISKTACPNFLNLLPVAVTLSYSDGCAVCYIHPVFLDDDLKFVRVRKVATLGRSLMSRTALFLFSFQ